MELVGYMIMGKIVDISALHREWNDPCDIYLPWVNERGYYAASCETCKEKCPHTGFHFIACTAHTRNGGVQKKVKE